MKNNKLKFWSAVIFALMIVLQNACAANVTDFKGILTDNCEVKMQPGKNIARYGIPYMYAANFSSYQIPSHASSSVYKSDGYFPENAIDGDLNTAAIMANIWNWAFVLDLQEESVINRIALVFAASKYPLNYDILVTTEEKPSIDKDGAAALRTWANNAELVIRESENRRSGTHEFNINPISARYVIVRDNVAQTNVRQMAIAEIEVNEAADFYLNSGDVMPSLYNLQAGNIRRVVNKNIAGGLIVNSLYDKNNKMTDNIIMKKFDGENKFSDIYIDKKPEYTDYSQTCLKDIYFVSSADLKTHAAPAYYEIADSAGMRYEASLNYYGDYIYVYRPEFAADESEVTYACAADNNSALCLEFDGDKAISAVDITFSQFGCPKNFDVVAESKNGIRKSAVCTVDNKKTNLRFEFETVTADKIYIYAKDGGKMCISDIGVYDKAPEWELRSFVIDSIDTLEPKDTVKTLD